MNKICKKYLSDIKTLFPLMGKEEKNFLKQFQRGVEDFCSETNPDSPKILYKEFGTPDEVLTTYIKDADTPYIIKKIRQTHLFKICISFALCLIITMLIIYCSLIYKEYKAFEADIPFFEETVIE